MKPKLHISTSNKVVVCEAAEKACPRDHFTSKYEAYKDVNNRAVPETVAGRDILIDAAAKIGVNADDLKDHNGISLVEAWEKHFNTEELPHPEVPTDTQSYLLDDVLDGLRVARLRGNVGIVFADSTEDLYNDNSENYSPSKTYDEHIKEGKTAYIEIYTRLGGGNRECYCDDYGAATHDPNCLATIVDGMQEHPRHVYDYDDSFDSTYASYYYSVTKEEAEQYAKIAENERALRSRELRSDLLQRIKEDEVSVTTFLAPNPKITEQIEKVDRKKAAAVKKLKLESERALKENNSYRNKVKLRTGNFGFARNMTRDISMDEVKAVHELQHEYNKGTTVSKIPTYVKNTLDRTTFDNYTNALRAKAKVAKIDRQVTEYEEMVEKVRKVDPKLAETLLTTTRPKNNRGTYEYQKSKEEVEAFEKDLNRTVKSLSKVGDHIAVVNDCTQEIFRLRKNQTWPGSVRSIPEPSTD